MSSLFGRLQDEIDSQSQPGGLSPVDLLDLPANLSKVIKGIIRRNGMKLADVAEALGQTPEATKETLDELIQKGYVRQVEVKNEIWYKARFARKPAKKLSSGLWAALDKVVEPGKE